MFLPKQCPDCGAMNPYNNSQCVLCKHDMTEVAPILTVPGDDDLPPAGYQPAVEPEEMAFFTGMIGFVAAVELSFNVQSRRPGKKRMQAARDLLYQTTEFVLRNRLGRTPTSDEISFITSVTEPGRFGEGITRFDRLMAESTDRTDPATLKEIEQLRQSLLNALDVVDHADE